MEPVKHNSTIRELSHCCQSDSGSDCDQLMKIVERLKREAATPRSGKIINQAAHAARLYPGQDLIVKGTLQAAVRQGGSGCVKVVNATDIFVEGIDRTGALLARMVCEEMGVHENGRGG